MTGQIRHRRTGRFAQSVLRANGFTLTELLAVLAVLVILAVLLVPAASNLTREAQSIVCINNLHQIGVAAGIEGANNRTIPVTTWVETLRGNVDGEASIFRCPASDDYYATSSGGASGGGDGTVNDVDISQYIEAWVLNWYVGGLHVGLNGGIYSFDNDTPWSIHMSQTQRNGMTASNFGNRVIGSYQGPGAPYPNDLVMWYAPDYAKLNATVYDGGDGSGVHFWAVEIYSWGGGGPGGTGSIHYRFTKPFIKVEPCGSGVKVWVSPLAPTYPGDPDIQRGSGYYGSNSTDFSIVGKVTDQTLSNQGPLTLMPARQFAISEWCRSVWNPQPGVPQGDLNIVPGPTLTCSGSGYEDYILLPPRLTEGDPGGGGDDPGDTEDLRTNYGLNELATTLADPETILAIDYVSPTVKIDPELDDWDTAATYDADADAVLDFARHRGKVHVLFVGGDVRAMDPDDINPKEATVRSRYWQR